MIRVSRGPEPEELRAARRRHLARAFLAFLAGRELTFTGYDCAKTELYHRQRTKRAHCERQVGLGSQPVEHFRPKDGALRSLRGAPQIWDRERYWWLAWTWENLLFSCGTCNGRDHKGNHFPLEDGSTPLTAPPRQTAPALPADCFELEREAPLLIDPSREDPLDHLRWYPVNAGAGVPDDLHLPDALRWRLRADEEPLEDLLVAVCQVRPWTVDQLSRLLERSPEHLGNVARGLVKRARLAKVPGTKPYQVRALTGPAP
jgi:hypothetical protein